MTVIHFFPDAIFMRACVSFHLIYVTSLLRLVTFVKMNLKIFKTR